MRGSPPFQALILMVTLLLLGWLGKSFIEVKHSSANDRQVTIVSPTADYDQDEAEIELTFSSLPLSYKLKHYADSSNSTVTTVLESGTEIENPSYHTAVIPSHSKTAYLLDVTWAEAPQSGTRHFVQVYISPINGQAQSFSLLTSSKEMQESFDYSTSSISATVNHHE